MKKINLKGATYFSDAPCCIGLMRHFSIKEYRKNSELKRVINPAISKLEIKIFGERIRDIKEQNLDFIN